MPIHQEAIIKMESLFNDASGIILVSAMALWLQQGTIKYQVTLRDFIISAFGGIVIGIITSLIMINFRQGMRRLHSWAPHAQNVMFILTPLIIYYIAEELHVSGIIAVASAGLMQNAEGLTTAFGYPQQMNAGLMVSRLIREMLNNTVFVVMGILIIHIIKADLVSKQPINMSWVTIGILLYVVNLLICFLYGKCIKMSNRGSLIYALGGVRGAVTLALVFSVADNVNALQFRQIILAETLMIILSMVIPSFIFPWLLPHDISERQTRQRIHELRAKMIGAGIQAVDQIYLPPTVRQTVIYDLNDQRSSISLRDFWRQWLNVSHRPEFSRAEIELFQRVLRWAFQTERDYLDMVSQKENMRRYVYSLYYDVLLAEAILMDPNSQDI